MATPANYKTFYKQIKESLTNDEKAKEIITEANTDYHEDSTDRRFRVAYKYRAAAEFFYDSKNNLSRASRLFHYAGHHFRKLEEWKNAGAAYKAKEGDGGNLITYTHSLSFKIHVYN